MLLWLRARQAAGQSPNYTEVCLENRDKALAIRGTFSGWAKAIEDASGDLDKGGILTSGT